MAIYGYDGSDFTHVMDFSGLSFVTHKATEADDGEIYYHNQFGPVMRTARDQGVPFLGAYVVPRSGDPGPGEEAQIAIDFVRQEAPWLFDHPGFFWQVDLENWPYDAVSAGEGDALADELQARTGKPVVIYASKGQYGESVITDGRPLWNANYNGSGSGTFVQQYENAGGDGNPAWGAYSGQVPAILQYSSDSIFADGRAGDANAFRGNVTEFSALLGTHNPAPSPVPPPAPGGSVSVRPPLRVLPGVTLDSVGRKTMEVWRRILPPDLASRMYVTSNFRDGEWDPANGSFHGALDDMGALDIAAAYNGFSDSQGNRDMRDACELLRPYFGSFKQVIHSTPFDTDNGYYIFDGHVSSYGNPNDSNSTAGQHRDHVHTAAHEGDLDRLLSTIPNPDDIFMPVPVPPLPVPDPVPVPTPVPTPVPATDYTAVLAEIDRIKQTLDTLATAVSVGSGKIDQHDARLVDLEEMRSALKKLLEVLAK